ncbi:photosynthetic reaction center cytochrome PufC [Primorskyibacter sp. S187A]|uniref:photosynthetic reaction center cytochrome PufC n=1 Tax=Primorskyibacter sp. S187A TaxID=3415130 RepID=UPI003C7C27C8
MFPKWFSEWNRENPTDIFGPAIKIGVLGGAAFVAIMAVAWGNPFADQNMQTGPRGNGMSVTKYEAEITAADPTLADYYDEEPWIPEEGEELAKDIYENVQVLGDLTDANFNRLMNAMVNWVAPDEGCNYCHAGADDGEYADDDLYTKVVARSMIQMTQSINEDWDGHVNAVQENGVNCYTCHRGQNVPSEIWFKTTPVLEATEGWASIQNRATLISQSTSLPSDALEKYLLEYETIAVHDLESRVAGVPGQDDYPGIQHAERTYSLMNYFSNSLGVNCVFCHNSRAFYDPGQVTPQWGTASLGIAMVQELNNDWLVPLRDVYPEHRLGPKYADAPKAACKTCHKGYQRPLQGMNVIANWPELASTEPPVYE